MPRVAAVDCGTNSIRLLIADVDTTAGALTDVVREMRVVRLGQGVDKTGQFAPEALERTLTATADYAALCAQHGVGPEAIRFIATSATRDASNRDEFISGVLERIGVEPEVVSGHEEAGLSFRGATGALGTAHPGPYLVVDLGGGSTEVVLGETQPTAAHSMDVGCVRMTERLLHSDPPTDAEVAMAADTVLGVLNTAGREVPLGRARTLVGLAGSITTVTAHALGLTAYEPGRIDGAVLTIDDAVASCVALINATRAERAAMPFMHPGRVDVIGAGALVWQVVMRYVQEEVAAAGGELLTTVTSEHDILDGIAWSVADGGR